MESKKILTHILIFTTTVILVLGGQFISNSKKNHFMKIERLDHLVLTVSDIEQTITFYTTILGMEVVTFGQNRKALLFGNQKLNLHQKGKEFEPKSDRPTLGAIDLCFIVSMDVELLKKELIQKGIKIIMGVVDRTGALGKIKSIYLKDPDGNLIELSNYVSEKSNIDYID